MLLLLSLTAESISFDSTEDGFEMLINHDPWWYQSDDGKSVESSYQYYFPFLENNGPGLLHWDMPPIVLKPPMPPIAPTPPSQPSQSESSTREWPSWIPPIRLIKLPLDEPPAEIS